MHEQGAARARALQAGAGARVAAVDQAPARPRAQHEAPRVAAVLHAHALPARQPCAGYFGDRIARDVSSRCIGTVPIFKQSDFRENKP